MASVPWRSPNPCRNRRCASLPGILWDFRITLLGAYRTAIDFYQRDVGLEPEQIAERLLEPWGAGVFQEAFTRLSYCHLSEHVQRFALPSSESSTRRCCRQSGP